MRRELAVIRVHRALADTTARRLKARRRLVMLWGDATLAPGGGAATAAVRRSHRVGRCSRRRGEHIVVQRDLRAAGRRSGPPSRHTARFLARAPATAQQSLVERGFEFLLQGNQLI